ncbi:hypothetical protein NHX12_024306, partial [Muraenolepis orangiensis]
ISNVPAQEGTWTSRRIQPPGQFVKNSGRSRVPAKRYIWVSSLVKDPRDSSSGRAVLTRVTVPERPAPAREAILIPGPAVSGLYPSGCRGSSPSSPRGKPQEVELPTEATGRIPFHH